MKMMRVPLAGALALGRALALAPARGSSLRGPARAFASRMPEVEDAGLKWSTGTGAPLECRAAVAFGVDDLRTTDVVVAAPKAGEVRLRVVANALCHTDIYTLEGSDPDGLFPSILGHEAGAIVESVGEGVTSVKVGDKVIPCYTPQCREADCIFCASPKTNLCPKIRGTQGQGVMPDGTTRFKTAAGTPVAHFMGCSTFAEYTVVSEISCAKIDDSADLAKVCMLGCGVATGWGAAWSARRRRFLYVPARKTIAFITFVRGFRTPPRPHSNAETDAGA